MSLTSENWEAHYQFSQCTFTLWLQDFCYIMAPFAGPTQVDCTFCFTYLVTKYQQLKITPWFFCHSKPEPNEECKDKMEGQTLKN